MRKFRYSVGFDFDGTICHSEDLYLEVMNSLAGLYGYRAIPKDSLESLKKLSTEEMLREIELSRWKLPIVVPHARRRMAKKVSELKPFDGVNEILSSLRQAGVPTFIMTSNSQNNVRRFMKANGLEVDQVIAGVSLFGKKRALKKIAKKCERVIYVGDETRDVDAANDSGVISLAVSWGHGGVESLKKAQPTHLVKSASDLQKILLKYNS